MNAFDKLTDPVENKRLAFPGDRHQKWLHLHPYPDTKK